MVDTKIDKESTIRFFAQKLITKIVQRSIKQFQKWKITLSGEDSGLINTWDEICVQIQDEYSFHWDDYEDAIENQLKFEIKKLNHFEQFAIWLQSENGYFYEDSEDEFPQDIEHDLLNFFKSEIFEKAGGWSNHRIRKYLDR